MITVGYVSDAPTGKERFIRGFAHRKSKAVEQMSATDATLPDWFINGVKAAVGAPSAINRQPVVFGYKGGNVSASVADISVSAMPLDLGIAKLHFELGAGTSYVGKWQWGNDGTFEVKS
ncbi:hypothetical protein FACS189490_12720 [Clostridia bacterium]|nr:hypothetical protein FACS189490_12720 [Clostridia bacterium]